jgi:branched-subunit amino acid aminotransferase/4-amino-4-deoxychorismate lyase
MAAEVRAAVAAAVQASGGGLRRLRLTWSPPRLFVSSEPFAPPAPELLEGGVVCATLELVRSDPRAKDSGFSSVAAEAHARLPPGVHEGLLVDRGGVILEGLSSNFFAIAGRELRTEGPRALAGVTRSLVLEAARGHLTPVERGVSLAELSRVVEECFLTSASRGILPVVRVDATVVGQGVPGPLTRELRARFDALVERELEPVQ